MRLDKYISSSAFLSRRDAARLISGGGVTVDGRIVRDGAFHVADGAAVSVNGRRITYKEHIYLMLSKPSGYITATDDARPGERVVNDLLPAELARRVFPVGRLDRDTTGLLIMTDDGDAAHRALSPKHHVKKTYRFTCEPPLTEEMKQLLSSGVDIGERDALGRPLLTSPAAIDGDTITITEGKFHQIKRMFNACGSEITSLERISFAGIALDRSIGCGGWRHLTDAEIAFFTQNNTI